MIGKVRTSNVKLSMVPYRNSDWRQDRSSFRVIKSTYEEILFIPRASYESKR